MEVQENNLKPLDDDFVINPGDYFIHIKTGNVYKIIECRNNLIKHNGEWIAGVIYTRGDIQSELFVRFIDDFRKHFSHAYSPVNEKDKINFI